MHTTVVIVGAGQAGLAMSHCLTARGIDHFVAERGEVAQSWRSERWDSLRLLTPNWMCGLPGWSYQGDDPDGYMTAAELISVLDGYRRAFDAPVLTGNPVECVRLHPAGFEVRTTEATWTCTAVVVASGASSEPVVPAVADELPLRINQLTALEYRNPGQLADGEVLVVGASASGVQIADELQRSGRPVTLAVGEHVRLPRGYRGRDIQWWMDAMGQLDERYDEVDDIERARRVPSAQLIGTPEHRTLDLNALTSAGVTLVGRVMAVAGRKLQLSGGLANLVASADLKQNRLLSRIDAHIASQGLEAKLPEPSRPTPTRIGAPALELDLDRFDTVVWATGYRPTFGWLDPAAFDRRGRVIHDGGVSPLPGSMSWGFRSCVVASRVSSPVRAQMRRIWPRTCMRTSTAAHEADGSWSGGTPEQR